ncbi:MAG: aminotransferase class I/II-fold pyridoxal phosphate-dependent enzyme [Muribaculaceae bacterium]|nr:aminotransferase class I/II-fold pyridoxal phosphate-dependent enzyme [Muribaculaceae bacterium]
MRAVILAAGMGKRLKDLTSDNTKCMVKVNGVTLIERMLRQLDKLNLSEIVIVVGYKKDKLKNYVGTLGINTRVKFIDNDVYDRTNNIYSLYLAKDELLKEDVLLLESDLIFEDGVLQSLIDDPRETLALVDKYESWMDGTCVKLGDNDVIESFVPGKKFVFNDIPNYYKTVNIYKFSKHFSATHYVPFLEAYSKALGNNEYYEQVLRVITMLDDPEIRAKRLEGYRWYEIDDIQDLDIASSIFATSDEEKLDLLSARYGGYWRYPKLKDFCYLVNPYYPPQKLIDEMKANFETLLTQYPSGMRVNSLLAAKNFGVKPEHIVVGNGAAELIKCIMDGVSGNVGFIRPTFEEYPNRYAKEKSIVYIPEKDGFAYDENDIIKFFDDKNVDFLVLVNPDNPSGNYISKNGVLKLVEWCKNKNIRIIADESFVDFSEEENSSLIDEDTLCAYKNLIVMKSISKSYGVPGVRLGIAASSDTDLILSLKKDVAIWNINSFGEFYLQIAEKYKKDYAEALVKIKNERAELVSELKKIKRLKVFPSQANYVMVEICGGDMSSRELTKQLLSEYDLYIKDLSQKIKNGGQYVRLAVRNKEDNMRLVCALKKLLK